MTAARDAKVLRHYVATLLANHGDDITEPIDPAMVDYDLADYLIHMLGPAGTDIHGLSLFFRRLIGGFLIGVLALILILTTAGAAS